MPLSLPDAVRDDEVFVAQLILGLDRPERCAVVVEGPDDVGVLQEHRGPYCRVLAAGNRRKVLHSVQRVRASKAYIARRMGGVIGLFDRDFDHLADPVEPIPEGLAWTTPRFNDIEAALLYELSEPVISGVVSLDALDADGWLGSNDGLYFDRLVAEFIAPIGAFRAAYKPLSQGRKLGGTYETRLVDRCWERVSSGAVDMFTVLAEELPSSFGEAARVALNRDFHQVLMTAMDDIDRLWGLVRGKDLVRGIACAVASSPARLHDRLSVDELARKIQERLLAKCDSRALRDCGVHESVSRASRADGQSFGYLKAG
jgi:hypothetical protein